MSTNGNIFLDEMLKKHVNTSFCQKKSVFLHLIGIEVHILIYIQ